MNNQVHLTTALVLGVALLSIPTLATALEVTANVLERASLVGKGAAVIVLVDITCSDDFGANPTVFVGVTLIQRFKGQGSAHGQGSNETPIICDNQPHPVTVTVTISTMDRYFKKGSALADASFVHVCNNEEFNNQCRNVDVQEEVRIR